MTNLVLDSAETQCNNFENVKANVFSTDIFADNASDPDIHGFFGGFFYKKNFYKKMALKNPKNFKKMLRKSSASNV